MRNVTLVVLVVVVLLAALVPAAMAAPDEGAPESAAANRTYSPAHWSGLARKYNASGYSIGWKWGGGIMQCATYRTGALCKAVNVYGTSLGYYVKVGSSYGLVK